MITTTSPLTRHIRLLVAVLVIAAAAIATQGVSAEPAHAKTKRTYVIDGPIGKGLLVKPSELSEGPDREYDGTIGFKNLIWSSWGQPTASAEGIWFWKFTGDRSPVTVTLSKVKRCGPYRLYTLMQVEYHSEPGTPTALPDRDMIYRINKRCVLTLPSDVRDPKSGGGMATRKPSLIRGGAKEKDGDLAGLRWQRWGRSVPTARGAYLLPRLTAELIQPAKPASVKASRLRYCKRSGTIVYTRLDIVGYGKATADKGMSIAQLRRRVGHGARHHYRIDKSIRRWCARPYDGYASAVG
jgi:hypothetical protein